MTKLPVVPTAVSAPRRARPETLFLVSTASLFVFFYLARADRIGTSAGDGWHLVTSPPLSPTMHFVAAALVLAVVPSDWADGGKGSCGWRWGSPSQRWRDGSAPESRPCRRSIPWTAR